MDRLPTTEYRSRRPPRRFQGITEDLFQKEECVGTVLLGVPIDSTIYAEESCCGVSEKSTNDRTESTLLVNLSSTPPLIQSSTAAFIQSLPIACLTTTSSTLLHRGSQSQMTTVTAILQCNPDKNVTHSENNNNSIPTEASSKMIAMTGEGSSVVSLDLPLIQLDGKSSMKQSTIPNVSLIGSVGSEVTLHTNLKDDGLSRMDSIIVSRLSPLSKTKQLNPFEELPKDTEELDDENPFNWITSTSNAQPAEENEENPFSWITENSIQASTTPSTPNITESLLSILKAHRESTPDNVTENGVPIDSSDITESTYPELQGTQKTEKRPKKPIKLKRKPKRTLESKIKETNPEPAGLTATLTTNSAPLDPDLQYSHIVVSRCRSLVLPDSILRSASTLNFVTFQHLLRFPNLLNFLVYCPQLTKIVFTDTSVQKPTIPDPIQLPGLRELHISNSKNPLTTDDYWLLEFFTRSVSTYHLEIFSFLGPDQADSNSTSSSPQSISTVSVQHARTIPKPSNRSLTKSSSESNTKKAFLAHFLIKNRSSLKSVILGGDGCCLFEQKERDLDPLQEVQLESLSFGMMTKGIEVLLKSQTNLRELTCRGFTRYIRSNVHTSMCKCIEKSCETLESVAIFPCVIGIGITNDLYAFNCSMFSRCNKLERLYLNITCARSEHSAQSPYGTIIGMENLPGSLVSIEIYTDSFLRRQLEIFAKGWSRFLSLERLVLSSSFKQRYLLMPGWIKMLLALPHKRSLDFFGGMLEKKGAIEEILRNGQIENVVVSYHPGSISFQVEQ